VMPRFDLRSGRRCAPLSIAAFLIALSVCVARPCWQEANAAEGTLGQDPPQAAKYSSAFRDPGDGTFEDATTGLVWEKKCARCGGPHDVLSIYGWGNKPEGYIGQFLTPAQWIESVNREGGCGYAGHSDWRLPTVWELVTLVSPESPDPVMIDPRCGVAAPGPYWSSLRADQESTGWIVHFRNGRIEPWNGVGYLRAVRGAVRTAGAVEDLGETLHDPATGLTWEKKCLACGGLHDAAVRLRATTDADSVGDWVEKVNREKYGGFQDWRIPSLVELLIAARPGTVLFPDSPTSDDHPAFWSATVRGSTGELQRWAVQPDGRADLRPVDEALAVWAVRGAGTFAKAAVPPTIAWKGHVDAVESALAQDRSGAVEAYLLAALGEAQQCGAEDWRVEVTHCVLAAWQDVRKRLPEARKSAERSVEIFAQQPSPDARSLALRLRRLAHIADQQGDRVQVAVAAKREVALLEKTGPEKSGSLPYPDLYFALVRLATAYESLERYDEAQALHERAVVLLETKADLRPSEMMSSYRSLITFYMKRRKTAEALRAYERVLELATKSESPHAETHVKEIGELCNDFFAQNLDPPQRAVLKEKKQAVRLELKATQEKRKVAWTQRPIPTPLSRELQAQLLWDEVVNEFNVRWCLESWAKAK
jgi:tetratricopeptide (TPR) repeat protein